MFKKVSNIDLMNRLTSLENKMDILNTNLDSQSLEGCCNCKSKEVLVYKELCEYLETKFSDLVSNITLKLDEKAKINENRNEELVINIHDTKDDIMDNLQTIITNLSLSNKENSDFSSGYIIEQLKNEMINYKIDTEQDICKILTLFENVNRAIDIKLDELNNKIGENMNGKFDVIDVKLNSIYFENEIIKHQLLLEDEIRKSIEEIGNINTCIDETVAKINKILNLK
jgi:hypothetical protein